MSHDRHERELATIPGIVDLRGDVTAIAGFEEYVEKNKTWLLAGARGEVLGESEYVISYWRRELESRNRDVRMRWERLRHRESLFVKTCGRLHARTILEGRLDCEAPAIVATRAWACDPSAPPIALLHGSTGRGKTQAAAFWCSLWIDHPNDVDLPQWISATDLAESSYTRMARFDDARAQALAMRRAELLETTPKLVIDDLGTEDDTDAVRANIDALVDRYYSLGARLLFTTNLTPSQIKKRYRARIADRLREVGVYIPVTGPNRRGEDEP